MQRGWMHFKPKGNSLPTFLRETLYDRPTGSTQVEVVILTAAEHEKREAVIQAARRFNEPAKTWDEIREITWDLKSALDALEETE